jgi:hypothetical protein
MDYREPSLSHIQIVALTRTQRGGLVFATFSVQESERAGMRATFVG